MCPLEAGVHLQDLQLAALSREALHLSRGWAWEAWALLLPSPSCHDSNLEGVPALPYPQASVSPVSGMADR